MSAGVVIDTLISKAARLSKKLKTEHLCDTCDTYHRRTCTVGRKITDGVFYHDELSDYILNDWGSDDVPGMTILITTCTHYKKERR